MAPRRTRITPEDLDDGLKKRAVGSIVDRLMVDMARGFGGSERRRSKEARESLATLRESLTRAVRGTFADWSGERLNEAAERMKKREE